MEMLLGISVQAAAMSPVCPWLGGESGDPPRVQRGGVRGLESFTCKLDLSSPSSV